MHAVPLDPACEIGFQGLGQVGVLIYETSPNSIEPAQVAVCFTCLTLAHCHGKDSSCALPCAYYVLLHAKP